MRKKTSTSASRVPATPKSAPKPTVTAVTSGSLPDSQSPTVNAIRNRAYQKWEAAGKPGGDGVQFWLEAERELQAQ
jgi:hypothetical protein